MIRLTAKVSRPNTKMAFYPRPAPVISAMEKVKQDGKLISENVFISKDKLTSTYVAIWNTQEDFKEFNQTQQIKEFHKKRRWFEQEFEHIRIESIEKINDTDL